MQSSALLVPDENDERPSRHVHCPPRPCANATEPLRVARDLRALVTYIEGCEGKDELLVRIEARWNERDSDPPPAAEDAFLKYMLHDTFLNHMLHEASSEPRALLEQLASAMEAS